MDPINVPEESLFWCPQKACVDPQMAHVVLGQDQSGKSVKLDLSRFIVTRMLIAANSGGGKSWTMRRLLEETHGKVQQIVLDYEGEFPTLREKFDYVLVGKGGEIAADPRYAPQLAKRLLELGVSAIVDMYELRAHERHHFVHVFLDALINLPKDLWHPCMVVVDEAHVFCPEKGKGESEASGSVIDLATRGRKRGYAAVLATQDIAKLNKDASGECRNRLIGLAVEDKTRKRAAEELGIVEKSEILALRNLQPGEFHAFGPAIANKVELIRIGPVQTKHPEVGTKWTAPPPPREKVRAILSKLADLPKEAEEERLSVDGLRRQLTDLKRQLSTRPVIEKSAIEIKQVEVPILKAEHAKRLESAAGTLERAISQAERVGVAVKELVAQIDRIVKAATERHEPIPRPVLDGRYQSAASARNHKQVAQAALERTRRDTLATSDDSKLGLAERKILTVLAQYAQGRTTTQVALLAGYAVDGGGFRNALGALRSKNLIDGDDTLHMTDTGGAVLGRVEPLPSPGADLLRYWMGKSGLAESEILRVLAEAWPKALLPDQIANETVSQNGKPYAPDGGGFRNALGRLRTLELVTGRKELKLSDDLME